MAMLLGKRFVSPLKGANEPTGYPEGWSQISANFRKKCGYICACCGVDCSTQPGLTDTHHINGVKNDCRDENLQCLCKICHANQDSHTHYKPQETDRQEILQLRKEQNIP